MLSWILVGVGLVLILLEVLMGAALGFDFVLLGSAIALGGGLGLLFDSQPLGLAASGVLALLYLAIGRRFVRSRYKGRTVRSNADAVLGAHGTVVNAVGWRKPGLVRVNSEEWRAEVVDSAAAELPPGQEVAVERVEGVTLIVRRAT